MVFPLNTRPSQTLVAVSIVFSILPTLAVICRVATRRMQCIKLALEDYLLIVTLPMVYANAGLTIFFAVRGGFGHHTTHLPPGIAKSDLEVTDITIFIYTAAMLCTRSSLCIFFARIFAIRSFRIAAYTILVLNVLWGVYSYVIVAVSCIPFSANWAPTATSKCLDRTAILTSIAAWGIVVDVAMWTLPIPVVWKLQMHVRQKIGLSAIFATGLIDIFVSVMRIVTILDLQYNSNFTWSAANPSIWSFLEPPVAIIAASAPVTKPLLDKAISKMSRMSLGRSIWSFKGSSRHDIRPPSTRSEAWIPLRPTNLKVEIVGSTHHANGTSTSAGTGVNEIEVRKDVEVVNSVV